MRSVLILALLLSGCPRTAEQPPCDQASLAKMVATCKDKADCHAQIEAREKTCGTRIEETDGGAQ